MVAAPLASSGLLRAQIPRALVAPHERGRAAGLLAAFAVVTVLAALAYADAFGCGDALTWATWLAATALGYLIIAVGLVRPGRDVDLRTRAAFLPVYACLTTWILLSAATMHSGRNEPEPIDLLLVGVVLGVVPAGIRLAKDALRESSPLSFFLDSACVMLAVFTMTAAILAERPGSGGHGFVTIFYPDTLLLISGICLLGIVAARLPLEPRGGYAVGFGAFVLGVASARWVDSWLQLAPWTLPPVFLALGLLIFALGAATSFVDVEGRYGKAAWAPAVFEIFPLAAICSVVAVLVQVDLSFDRYVFVGALVVVSTAVVIAREVVLLSTRRRLTATAREAQRETRNALDRLAIAEARQRTRADRLAEVLKASEALVLVGEGDVAYEAVLPAVATHGSSAFLARLDPASGGYRVIAAHGPAREMSTIERSLSAVAPLREVVQTRSAVLADGPRDGDAAPGPTALPEVATLTIPLFDRSAQPLGVLHLIDHEDEGVLEADSVAFAQLVANQIAIALENQQLVVRAHEHVAEVKQVQEQLVHASKMSAIGELAAAIAHEVNNPLTGILGFAELLLGELPDSDPHHEDVSVIRREAVRARGIMRVLLDFAQPRPVLRASIDLNELVRGTVDLVRHLASQTGVSIVEEYGDLPIVEIDPDGMKQVVLNLCNNALRAMPEGGELRISTRRKGPRVLVVVADDGVGMRPEVREKIFNPFFAATAANRGRGGIGLPVSLQIVQSHGGSIDVASEPERGSVMTIRLPIVSPAPRRAGR